MPKSATSPTTPMSESDRAARLADLAGAAELLADLPDRLPGWEWILRPNDDARGAFFFNLLSPDFESHMELTPGGGFRQVGPGQTFPTYASSAVGAVSGALAKVPPIFFEEDSHGLG